MPGQPVFINGIPIINNLQAAQNYAVNMYQQWEAVTQSLYDSASYVAAGQTQLTFFQQPVGQGTGFGGAAKTLSDTNMQLAGQLPAMQAFIVTGINVECQPTTPTVAAQMPAAFGAQAIAQIVNDAYIVRRSGNLNFTIGSKSYLNEGPLMRFPAPNDFEIHAALSDVTTAGANLQSRIAYGFANGPSQILAPNNLLLIPNQAFSITLNWPEGAQAITNPMRIFVRLEGVLLRAAQ